MSPRKECPSVREITLGDIYHDFVSSMAIYKSLCVPVVDNH